MFYVLALIINNNYILRLIITFHKLLSVTSQSDQDEKKDKKEVTELTFVITTE
jgi:hypothetical protein